MTEPSAEVIARAEEQGLVISPLEVTIDRDTYTPALIGLLNNILIWGGSRVFRHVHGVGTNEWRIISALGNHPGATASELCDILGMNKSIASKSVNELLSRRFIAQLDGPRGSRHLYLTTDGAGIHDDFMPIAMRRQEILHESLAAEEVAQLNALLVKMLGAGESLQRYEKAILAGAEEQETDVTSTVSGAKGTPGA